MIILQLITFSNWAQAQCPSNTSAVYLSGIINSGGPYIYNSDVIIASGSYLDLQGVTFVFNEGRKLIVEPNASLTTDNVHFENGCIKMWRGIELQNKASAKINNTTIDNAEYGVQVSDKTWLTVSNCIFYRNYVGIYVEPFPGTHTLYNFDINGTQFLCSPGSLIQPYSGQTNVLGAVSKAGIVLNNCNVSIDGGVNVNSFIGLSNGIISNLSIASVSNCYFENIFPDPAYSSSWNGSGIFCNGSGVGALYQSGFGYSLSSPPSFVNCNYGINVEKCELISGGNTMQNMVVGYRAYNLNAQELNISGNYIYCSLYGIESQYNDFASYIKFELDNIELDDQSNGILNGAGIFVNEYGLAATGITKTIQYPMITVVHGKHGILLQNCNGFDIYGGGSTTNIFAVSPKDCYQGVSVYGGEKNSIRCTTVDFSEPGDKLSSKADFAFNNSISCDVWCNHAYNGYLGFRFDGNCNPCDFVNNEMKDNGHTGLYLDASGEIGPQLINKGNKWFGSFSGSSGIGAICMSNPFNSRFEANPLAPPYKPLIVFPPTGWFSIGFGSPYDCSIAPFNFPSCYQPYSDAYSTDSAIWNIASGQSGTIAYSDVADYRSNKYFTEEYLKGNGVGDLLIENYYDSISDLNYELLASIKENTGNLKNVNPGVTGLISQTREMITQLMDSLVYDRILIRNMLHPDSGFIAGFMNKQDSLMELSISLSGYDSLFKSNIQSGVDLIKTDNDAIQNLYLQSIEKGLNNIYFDRIIKGETNLSGNDISFLTSLAAQCPLSGGELVFKARGILSLLYPFISYPDSQLCNDEGIVYRKDAPQDIQIEFNVHPNPAFENLIIESQGNIFEPKDAILSLFSMDGKPVLSQKIICSSEHIINLPLTHIPAGIYYLKIETNNLPVFTKRLVVVPQNKQ